MGKLMRLKKRWILSESKNKNIYIYISEFRRKTKENNKVILEIKSKFEGEGIKCILLKSVNGMELVWENNMEPKVERHRKRQKEKRN